MSRLWMLSLWSALLLGATGERPVPPPDPLSPEWCLERAIERNPSLAAAEAASRAAQHRIVPAGSLADPRFGYELSNIPRDDLDLRSTPLSGQQFRLSQKLPFPGLLRNRERAARAGTTAAVGQLENRRLRVASEAERAWAELGFAQRALGITDRNIHLLRQFTEIAEAKYSVGSGLQQDVLRAQVQLTALLQERLRRKATIRTAEAALADLLDLPPGLSFPRTTELDESSSLPQLDTLLSQLADTSPLLQVLAARVEEAEHRHRVAELEGYPDLDMGIGYRIRRRVTGDLVEGDDFLSAGVTIRLPLNRTKWRERIAEHSALLRRAKAEHRGGRAMLRGAIRTVGRVEYDERLVAHVHTKVQGWVEKLYIEYEGQMVVAGQPLLEIYSPELVSTQEELLIAARYRDETSQSDFADVYEYELPWVSVGHRGVVELSYLPGEAFEGEVTYIYPFLDPKTRSARIRIELPNPEGILKPDMYANVSIETETQPQVLAIPEEAVLRSGKRNLALVALGERRFEPRQIVLGIDSGEGWVEVREGLQDGENIVTSGQFLIDSESRLQEAVQKFLTPIDEVHDDHDMPSAPADHEMQADPMGDEEHTQPEMSSGQGGPPADHGSGHAEGGR